MTDFSPKNFVRALAAFAEAHGVRDDWHESDVRAKVYGDHLDNACGPHARTRGEFWVRLRHGRGAPLDVNLADVFAALVAAGKAAGWIGPEEWEGLDREECELVRARKTIGAIMHLRVRKNFSLLNAKHILDRWRQKYGQWGEKWDAAEARI